MATKKELLEYLDKITSDDDATIYVAVDRDDDVSCCLYTDFEIIGRAEELYMDEERESIDMDINDALQYLAEQDTDRFYYEINV